MFVLNTITLMLLAASLGMFKMLLMQLAWEEDFQNEDTLFVDPYQRKPWLQMIWKSLYPKTCQLHYSHTTPDKCLLKGFFQKLQQWTFNNPIWCLIEVQLEYFLFHLLFLVLILWTWTTMSSSPLLKIAFSVPVSSPILFSTWGCQIITIYTKHTALHKVWRSTAVLAVWVIGLTGGTTQNPGESLEARKMISWTLAVMHHTANLQPQQKTITPWWFQKGHAPLSTHQIQNASPEFTPLFKLQHSTIHWYTLILFRFQAMIMT